MKSFEAKMTDHGIQLRSDMYRNPEPAPAASVYSVVFLLIVNMIIHVGAVADVEADSKLESNYSRILRGHRHSKWTPFQEAFPEKLRQSFDDCASITGEGEKAACLLIAATKSQASIVRELITTIKSGQQEISPSTLNDACNYRNEGGRKLFLHASERSSELQALLDSYSDMHRNCVSWEYSKLKDLYERKVAPECRYVVWSCPYGLGNKLLSLISSFLYALLSQRVLLVDNSDWEALFCEAFVGSKWIMPSGFTLTHDHSFPSFSEFYDHVEGSCESTDQSGKDSPACNPYVLSALFSEQSKPSDHRFLVCPSAFTSALNVPIITFRNSNQHFGMGFFLNPLFRPALETLFPNHKLFHILSGFLLNPSQSVWQKVKSFHGLNLANSSRRIGVQLREFKGHYKNMYDTASFLCIKSKSGLCPIEVEQARAMMKKDPNFLSSHIEDYISVYVSSLAGGHYDQLKKSIREIEQEMGQNFRVFAQDADGEQLDDVGHVGKALLDIWLLSLSDVLMTSHMSTFGYVAQGLAGITPHLLKPWRDNPCWLSVSSDPCFHFGPKEVGCRKDRFVMKNPLKEANYVSACPDFPTSGLQLGTAY